MSDLPQQLQREGTAGAATTILSLSRNSRSDFKNWRFDDLLVMQAKQNTYNGESHISLPNFGKASEENREQQGQQGPRTSVRKSNLKVKPHCNPSISPCLRCRCPVAGFGW